MGGFIAEEECRAVGKGKGERQMRQVENSYSIILLQYYFLTIFYVCVSFPIEIYHTLSFQIW